MIYTDKKQINADGTFRPDSYRDGIRKNRIARFIPESR